MGVTLCVVFLYDELFAVAASETQFEAAVTLHYFTRQSRAEGTVPVRATWRASCIATSLQSQIVPKYWQWQWGTDINSLIEVTRSKKENHKTLNTEHVSATFSHHSFCRQFLF